MVRDDTPSSEKALSAMSQPALVPPPTDPSPIFDAFRGNHATEILTASVAHFSLFGRLAERGAQSFEDLRSALGLQERPAHVLFSVLRALGLLVVNADGKIDLTALSREHLIPGAPFDVGGYVVLMADSPGVLSLVERLRTNRPAGADDPDSGAAFIYREGIASAMESAESARHFTLALAGRARNVAPVLARQYPLEAARQLLDVGGGTGLYSIAFLQENPGLRAQVWDRPEVLAVAREMALEHGVADRLDLVSGDMFTDPVPSGCDTVLLSNVLHDWDVPECRTLVGRLARALPPGGRLLVHDVFLDDDLSGPLPVALYSASLFTLSEGRAYSASEYREWLREAGLEPGPIVPTLVHCGVLPAEKPGR
jgi:ubiquinone/menaquinone biosynthesis C-methylase UbiE